MAEEPSETPVPPVVFDTDILIWYFRANEKARRFLERMPHLGRALSSLTIMELLQGCRSREEIRDLKRFINENIPIVLHTDESICRRAISFMEQHSLSHGLRAMDALIAATAIEAGYSLASANVKHYRVISGLHLIPFQP